MKRFFSFWNALFGVVKVRPKITSSSSIDQPLDDSGTLGRGNIFSVLNRFADLSNINCRKLKNGKICQKLNFLFDCFSYLVKLMYSCC